VLDAALETVEGDPEAYAKALAEAPRLDAWDAERRVDVTWRRRHPRPGAAQ
jgi:hypothetical protein